MLNFVTYRELIDDVSRWVDARPDWYEYRGIVGIPQSGMVPAHIIASRCGLPINDLESYLDTGGRFRPSRHIGRSLSQLKPDGKVLVMDDSFHDGTTMRWAESELKSHAALRFLEYEFAAVYSSHISIPRSYYRVVDDPRMFEWNWLRNPVLHECLLDLDGLICEDPQEGLTEGQYLGWIPQAKPKNWPRVPLGIIVSARLEKFRRPTEQWLKEHGITYHHLFLVDATAEERQRDDLYVEVKVRHYQNSQGLIFIESDHRQANQIALRTGRPVLCMGEPTTFYGGSHDRL